MKGKTELGDLWLLAVGAVIVWILMGVFGTQSTQTTQTGMKFVYDNDQTFYAAKGISTMPADGFLTSDACKIANGKTNCLMTSICLNCVAEKIQCVCQK